MILGFRLLQSILVAKNVDKLCKDTLESKLESQKAKDKQKDLEQTINQKEK